MFSRTNCGGLGLILAALSGSAYAQTPTAFNLTCAPKSHHFEGANSFGAPLKLEDYQGVAEETIELAIDLTAKRYCNPRYCTSAQWGSADPILSISAKEVILDDIAAREVESNDYNVMAYRRTYQPASQTLTVSFSFFDEAKKTRTGTIALIKSCSKSAFALSPG